MSSTEKKLVRVLVVEDSRAVTEFLTHVLNSDPQIRVVGTALNGEEALAVRATRQPRRHYDGHPYAKVNGFDARAVSWNLPDSGRDRER